MTGPGERGQAGPAGETGEAGLTGSRGEAGVAGRQGEAGVPGPQGEAGVTGRTGTEGHPGAAGEAGARGGIGRRGRSMSAWQTLALAGFVVFAFLLLAWLIQVQQSQLRTAQQRIVENQRRITALQFAQCTARNEGARRQNALIDSAIAAERRKPAPDLQRIHDLLQFRPGLLDCGPPPKG